MGVVYLVKEHPSGEEVVLKLIHPSLVDEKARQRMITEGVNARKITNPHVVRIFDIGEHEGQVYLTMEHVEGRPLRGWLADNMTQRVDAPLGHVLKITHEILAGLAAAHEQGIIHRDLKPENVMIKGSPGDDDFALKILDFGIARGLKTEVFTGSTPAMGTPLYMAPEQRTTPDGVGPSADIYSVGRMLFEMLMDALPDGIWTAPSEQRTDIPKPLDAVIQKALNLSPKRRYETVAEFALALDGAMKGAKDEGVSNVVWQTEGGASLLASLKELDSTINERIAGGVKWLSDNLKTGGQTGSPGGGASTSEDQGQTRREDDDHVRTDDKKPEPSGQSRRKMIIGAGVAGLVVIGALLMGEEGPVDPPPPPPPPPGDNISGTWRLEGGSSFSIAHDEDYISGTGVTQGWGQVVLDGPINGPIEVTSMMTGDTVGVLQGRLVDGAQPGIKDWSGTLIDHTAGGARYQILFHINH